MGCQFCSPERAVAMLVEERSPSQGSPFGERKLTKEQDKELQKQLQTAKMGWCRWCEKGLKAS